MIQSRVLGLIQHTDCIVEQTEGLQSQTRGVYRRSGNFALRFRSPEVFVEFSPS